MFCLSGRFSPTFCRRANQFFDLGNLRFDGGGRRSTTSWPSIFLRIGERSLNFSTSCSFIEVEAGIKTLRIEDCFVLSLWRQVLSRQRNSPVFVDAQHFCCASSSSRPSNNVSQFFASTPTFSSSSSSSGKSDWERTGDVVA